MSRETQLGVLRRYDPVQSLCTLTEREADCHKWTGSAKNICLSTGSCIVDEPPHWERVWRPTVHSLADSGLAFVKLTCNLTSRPGGRNFHTPDWAGQNLLKLRGRKSELCNIVSRDLDGRTVADKDADHVHIVNLPVAIERVRERLESKNGLPSERRWSDFTLIGEHKYRISEKFELPANVVTDVPIGHHKNLRGPRDLVFSFEFEAAPAEAEALFAFYQYQLAYHAYHGSQALINPIDPLKLTERQFTWAMTRKKGYRLGSSLLTHLESRQERFNPTLSLKMYTEDESGYNNVSFEDKGGLGWAGKITPLGLGIEDASPVTLESLCDHVRMFRSAIEDKHYAVGLESYGLKQTGSGLLGECRHSIYAVFQCAECEHPDTTRSRYEIEVDLGWRPYKEALALYMFMCDWQKWEPRLTLPGRETGPVLTGADLGIELNLTKQERPPFQSIYYTDGVPKLPVPEAYGNYSVRQPLKRRFV